MCCFLFLLLPVVKMDLLVFSRPLALRRGIVVQWERLLQSSAGFFQAIVNSSYVGHAKAGDRSHREGKRATNPAALKPPPPHIHRQVFLFKASRTAVCEIC